MMTCDMCKRERDPSKPNNRTWFSLNIALADGGEGVHLTGCSPSCASWLAMNEARRLRDERNPDPE